MSGQLQHVSDDGPLRCYVCGAEAAGPCARCRKPVCGDCCVLTEGGAKLWAICTNCEARGGRSLLPGWMIVLSWILVPIFVLAAVLTLSLPGMRRGQRVEGSSLWNRDGRRKWAGMAQQRRSQLPRHCIGGRRRLGGMVLVGSCSLNPE